MMPQFEVYQLIGPIISLFFIVRLSRQYFRNEKRMVTVLIWMIFWVGVAVLAIIPNPVTVKLAELLGFRSNVTAIIFVSLAVLFLLVFYQSSQITKLEAQLTNLVRQIAKEEIKERAEVNHKKSNAKPKPKRKQKKR